MKLKLFIVLLLQIAFAGCATHNVPKDFNFTPPPQKSIIVGSLTHSASPSGEQPFFSNSLESYMVHYRKTGSKKGDSIYVNYDAIFSSSHFDDIQGEVFIIELEAGEYELYSWYVNAGTLSMRPTKIFSIPFTAKPGSITYIGEINLEILYAKNLLGMAIISALKINIKDSYDRDRKTMNTKYKNLANKEIVKNLIKSTSSKKNLIKNSTK